MREQIVSQEFIINQTALMKKKVHFDSKIQPNCFESVIFESKVHTGRFDTNINRYTFWSDLEIAQVEITRETKAG